MSAPLEWWQQFLEGLHTGGFHEFEERPEKSTEYESGGEATCPGGDCDGEPEYHDFFRADDYLAFIVCPKCGGVWNPETLERFH